MKKLLSITIAFLILFSIGCKKDEPVVETTSPGSWKVGANTYSVTYSNAITTNGSNAQYLYTFADGLPIGSGSVNYITIAFKTKPVAGTYELIGGTGNASLSNTQCEITAANINGSYMYGYLKANAKVVEVSISSGKTKITVPELSLTSSTSSGLVDVKFSATVQEK